MNRRARNVAAAIGPVLAPAAASLAVVFVTVTAAPSAAAQEQEDYCGEIPYVEDPYEGSPRVAREEVGGLVLNVLFPADYATSGRSYPVLHLFHGGVGDQSSWLRHTDLVRFTAHLTGDQAAIVVLPKVPSSGLGTVDFRSGKRLRETLYLRTVIPYIDSHYRTIADGRHRAIAGLSAGGFGAAHLAARRPDMFAAAGTFGGAGDLPPEIAYPLDLAITADCGGEPGEAGMFGDPARNSLWARNANPRDLAENFDGMTVYIGTGNGVPCDARDAAETAQPAEPEAYAYTQLEAAARVLSKNFSRALMRAGVAHQTDFRPCGLHTYRWFEHDLHTFWQHMTRAFGSPPPQTFDFRNADPKFEVFGWSFTADPRRAPEFLEVRGAGREGLTLIGSGVTTVTTAPLFARNAWIRLSDGRRLHAGRDGRLTFTLTLGPPHEFQQYTAQAALAGQRFTRRTIRFYRIRTRK
jgi:diacylglycerol O-acyltransferase/trehalose O-mycolyltransferase